ncbi:hypothetical protein O181_077077 [Austropuccinia psidii MF-1]|uniref:Integrase catalytic domain-containing protein n=1 Tax=Austropuccinia psidii MF-1 TaxID=1389203 RepID=A0A9Q3FI14_9BASI|nr:hypothetical protein [Austropuccinia psidii MF-1]
MASRPNDYKDELIIPILDGSNYSEWYQRMRFLLRSRDLLDVCENPLGQEATPTAITIWNKLSFEAITLITSRVNRRVFLEIINSETSDKANLLWTKINEQYASKRALNKGRVWMHWQKSNYNGNLQLYIDNTRTFLYELESVSIKVPSEILSYIILGKLAGDTKLSQIVELLTLNDNLIGRPDQVLSRLQEYVHLQTSKPVNDHSSASALVSSTQNHPYKIMYYCANGKHNPKCTTHKKEECYAENPHLRPPRRENKRRATREATAHLASAPALITNANTLQELVVDCGATHHMFHSRSVFSSLSEVSRFSVSTGDSASNLYAVGIGTVNILVNNRLLTLTDCLLVPKLNCNLVSLLQLFKHKITITRANNNFSLETTENLLLQGEVSNNLMKISFTIPMSYVTTVVDDLWHQRLGHPGKLPVKSMGLPSSDKPCKICDLNKAAQIPFKGHFEQAILPLDCIHIDLVGPITPPSISGARYFLTIVDQATSFKITRFLKNKSEAYDQFVSVKKLMENRHDRTLKKLVSDRGGEFLNNQFKTLADSCGFQHIFSPSYTPQHNGVVERANQTILEKAKCLLNGSNLPKLYWAEAINTATTLSNLIPTPSRHNMSPYTLWTKFPPRIKKLKVFGCQAVVLVPKEHREWKLSESGSEGIFLGYENEMTSYRIL